MKYTWLLFGACLGIQKWKLTYAKAQSTAE
jgi:hypothetical protein